jgi:O-antigen/teichoic acid export membrane protein
MFSMSGLNALKAVASLVVSTVVAGAVPPDQYGLVAFGIPLVALLTLLTDLGLASALIRDPKLDRAQAGAAVSFMAISGFAGGLALAGLSGWIEHASALHGLAPLLVGFSLVTVLWIYATAPRALLERQLAYGRIGMIEGAAMLTGLAAFGMGARASLGIFSLVVYHVTVQAIRSVAFTVSAWPFFNINFRFSRIMGVVRIGAWLFITNLMSYAARNGGTVLVGSFLGATALGLYGLASQFMTIPLLLISWPVSGVLMSTLARIQDDPRRKAHLICAIVTATAAITFPLMTFLTFGARFPLEWVYGHRWVGLADLVSLLAPVGAIQSIAAYNGAVLVERGAVRLNFALAIVNVVGLSGIFFLSAWLGLHAMMVTYCVSAIAVSSLLIYFMCRVAGIGLRRFAACLIPGAGASIAGVVCVLVAKGLSAHSLRDWMELSGLYAAGVLLAFIVTRGRIISILRALTVSVARPAAEVAE